MTYEVVETRVNEINTQLTKLNNEIVSLTWIDKDFSQSKVKKLQKQIDKLMDEKYELKDLLA